MSGRIRAHLRTNVIGYPGLTGADLAGGTVTADKLNSDVVIPTDGIYMFTAAVEWDPSGVGFRRIEVRVDGQIVAEDAGPAPAGGK